jgi:8-oxo-dGTP pyrophosphatase MutT (NUDIX family)
MSGEALDMATSIGLHVAGCRETFEECGVLLARRPDGSPCDPAQIERLRLHREAVAASGGAFLQMLQSEDLYLDVARLVYWAHWITPSRESKRYDTRFFAVEVPPGQEASVDRNEATEHVWITADEAFERSQQGAMKLAPPTLATLQDLRESYARHGALASLLAGERRREVPPILPKLLQAEGKWLVVLPWDPEYAQLGGEACIVADRYPGHLARQPSRREIPPRPVKSA